MCLSMAVVVCFPHTHTHMRSQVFDIMSGQQLTLLTQGHYDTVTAAVYSPLTGHLWSTGLDGAVLAWAPWTFPADPEPQAPEHYMDAWLAAATAGRGRQQRQFAVAGGGAAAGQQGSKAPLPDVDFWSDDEDLLIGGGRCAW